MSDITLPPWAQKHLNQDPPEPIVREWILARPKSVQVLMRQFPPSCLVKSAPDQHLVCPPPDSIGVVVSYYEDGLIGVANPDLGLKAQCQPEWLEVVAILPPITHELVSEILDEA